MDRIDTRGESHRLPRSAGLINSTVFSPDSNFVLTASDDGTARVWDAHTGVSLAILSA
jgi:WD40 repeat protein